MLLPVPMPGLALTSLPWTAELLLEPLLAGPVRLPAVLTLLEAPLISPLRLLIVDSPLGVLSVRSAGAPVVPEVFVLFVFRLLVLLSVPLAVRPLLVFKLLVWSSALGLVLFKPLFNWLGV